MPGNVFKRMLYKSTVVHQDDLLYGFDHDCPTKEKRSENVKYILYPTFDIFKCVPPS